jgi:ABC-2 type transport system ATP-binding protein
VGRVTATVPAPATTEPTHPRFAITTRALTKTYTSSGQGVTAVDAVDLDVMQGEIFGLLGPNGAGKTTTIGMLTTRVVPTGGTANVGGVDVAASPAGVKQRIGVVPQTNTLDRSITVWENLYFHGRYFALSRAQARARADELLGRFRLTEKRDVKVDTLSGGMAQRLMVARALLHRPAVLFLDEPTTGLDPQSRIALWDLLREFHAEGQTILLTTHYMEEAEQLCDRLAIMDHGRLLALGTPRELIQSVQADTIVRFTADGDLTGLTAALGGDPAVTHADIVDGAVRLTVTAGDGLLPRLLLRAENQGYAVADVGVAPPTLETVFIELTGRDLRE